MRTSVHRCKGGTLFELLIAIALSAVLMMALVGSMHAVWRYTSRGMEISRNSQSLRALLRMIVNEIEFHHGRIIGEPNALILREPIHIQHRYIATGCIAYISSSSSDRRGAPSEDGIWRGTTIDDHSNWELLTDKVVDLRFAYLDGNSWNDEYSAGEQSVRPLAVRITASVESGDKASALALCDGGGKMELSGRSLP